jgi:hypothetical protein
MNQKQPGPHRTITPRTGWSNIFASQDCGDAQLNQGRLYKASYHNRPMLRLIYNPKDYERTGKAVITVRCVLCGVKSRAFDSFQDYPLIGTIDVSTIRRTLTMNTGRILNHLATQHQEDLGGVDDVDFFNSLLDCCHL